MNKRLVVADGKKDVGTLQLRRFLFILAARCCNYEYDKNQCRDVFFHNAIGKMHLKGIDI